MRQTITFRPSGQAECLYGEAIDLSRIGRLHLRRATTIKFDNAKQVWKVRDTDGFPLYSSPSRQVCLNWERQYFAQKEDDA